MNVFVDIAIFMLSFMDNPSDELIAFTAILAFVIPFFVIITIYSIFEAYSDRKKKRNEWVNKRDYLFK